MKTPKRKIDLLVLSDIHLGTYGCHAKELHKYLKSVDPKKVILNGDIIDIWQFNKRYWPKSHMRIIKHLLGWMAEGVDRQRLIELGNAKHDLLKARRTILENSTSVQIIRKEVDQIKDDLMTG